jgi:steroid delta-isomerase
MSAAVECADVAVRAMEAVGAGRRDEWLGLFAADAVLEDPVGQVPARRGAAEIAEFWDTGIAGLEDVRFDVTRVHGAGPEAIVLADVSIRAPGGASATYDVAVHYVLDDAGSIASLRAFWDLASVASQLAAG